MKTGKILVRVAVQQEAGGSVGYVVTKLTAEDLKLTDAELGERYLGPAVRQAILEMDGVNA